MNNLVFFKNNGPLLCLFSRSRISKKLINYDNILKLYSTCSIDTNKSKKIDYINDSEYFIKRHIGPTEEEKKAMLAKINFKSIDELITATVPKNIRLNKPLNLENPLTETELISKLKKTSSTIQHEWRSYIGMGYYNCITPSVIQRNMFENPGWITQYTPYQAEIAQGRLESLLNYQTMVTDLTGLPISNASLLDEGTAAAEAMQMAFRFYKFKKNSFLVSKNVHPQTLAVVETRANAIGLSLKYFDETITSELDNINFNNLCGILLQYPNSNGDLIDLSKLNDLCEKNKSMIIAATDPFALTLIKQPGEYSAVKIAVGSTQRFGVPLNYGGPHAGFLATDNSLTRLIPGRIVGITKDQDGNHALRLALQAREQHIRRDKATSNICTSQALLANMSAMYAIYHGPEGLKKIAQKINRNTNELANAINHTSKTSKVVNENYFDTLRIKVDDINQIKQRAEQKKINLRYFDDNKHVGLSLDETITPNDLNDLKYIFGANIDSKIELTDVIPNQLKRKGEFLQHKVFNTYQSETSLIRYMKRLENKDISLVHSMIPLGSCTMKLNGTTEILPCSWPHFANMHPFVPLDQSKGYIEMMNQLEHDLCEITGYKAVSFQPNSGAQGEYAGLRVIKAHLEAKGQSHRNICLIPISAHGTNPASAQMAGFKVEIVLVDKNGRIDLHHLKKKIEEHKDNLACLMVTYPSTFGIFEETIEEICKTVHDNGGQIYLDGANMNAQLGLCRPGDYGSDCGHLNLHKTFCIPHGGSGPGVGVLLVKEHLVPYLPNHPVVNISPSTSFGSVSAAPWGSAAILPISWSFIKMMGPEGLKHSSEIAILNANYMSKILEKHYKILYRGLNNTVAHEFIVDTRDFKKTTSIEAMDIAKRLQDYGFHAPTVSWPVTNTLMVEPTESENKEQLDMFCDAMIKIREEIDKVEKGIWDKVNNPLKQAPHTQKMVCSDNWNMPYSREIAAFPLNFVKPETKIWPTVRRTDDTYGDTNLFCTCAPLESYT